MQVTFGNNLSPVPAARKPQQGQPWPISPAPSGANDVFVRHNDVKNNVKFGADLEDPDLDDFRDLVDGQTPPDHLLDDIVHGTQRVNPDGSISFPVNHIDKPSFRFRPGNPPDEAGNENEDGEDGDGTGQKPGKPGPGDPDTGVGPGEPGDEVGDGEGEGEGNGDKAGEGEGEGGREIWSSPFPPSKIAELLGKAFGLPNLQDRGRGQVNETFETFTSHRKSPPGKVLFRPTVRSAAGREMALVDFDNVNLDEALKKFKPALAKFEKKLTRYHADGASGPFDPASVTAFQAALTQFERSAFPVVESTRDKKFDAVLAQFKEALPLVENPNFLKTALPAFKKALDNIQRRDFANGSDIFINKTQDIRRIAAREETRPHTQAIIFYVMDVSGSVTDDMKQMARTNNFLLSTWLKFQYGLLSAKSQGKRYSDKDFFGKGVQERYVIHTDGAKEVSSEEFYTTRQSGGTTISSAYAKILEILKD